MCRFRSQPVIAAIDCNGGDARRAWQRMLLLGASLTLGAQAAKADAVPTPSMAGPLAANPQPMTFDAGPLLGNIFVTGAVSGILQWQDNVSLGDRTTQFDLSNGQVFIQKTDGLIQFFVEVGAYSLPDLGAPYIRANSATSDFFGAVPQAFVKIAPTGNFNVEIGKLPTLTGAEYTFSFENMNIERGLLWNQENAVNRGVQANYTAGPLAISVSWNDGFYSDRYSWLSGSVAWTIDPADTLTVIASGNLAHTSYTTLATPLQNNEDLYNIIYTRTEGPWTITPYFQYTHVPASPLTGVATSADTYGGALLVNYNIDTNWNLAGRVEYNASTGSRTNGAPNLMYGPGSKAWSFTVTPTYQYKIFFARAEASYVSAQDATPGFAFGANFNKSSQARLLLETGVLF